MAEPRVAVVVTCYNLGKYLDEAVDSVLAQTFQDFEILVVDDGSTDEETVRLLSDYRRPKTRVIHIENRGLSGARNEGIRRTSGAYVCCLDADDRLAPNYLEKSVSVLRDNAEVAFVSHWLETFGDESETWKPMSAGFPALLDMNTVSVPALVRREGLLKIGLFDETFRTGCEDWDLWISMVESGLHGVILPEVLFYYRRRARSMSQIMMEGDTHTGLYRRLIDKHRSSFETHLVDLLVRREQTRTGVRIDAHDVELDCDAVEPEIERLREGLRLADRRLQDLLEADAARQAQLDAIAALAAAREHDREVVAALERVNREKDTQQLAASARLAQLESELLRDREGIEGLKFEIRMLRASLSWRLTRPLRAVYSRLFERG